jgi:hypothetical protein
LLKSVTYPTGDPADEYRTRTIGLTCSPFHPSIRFMFHTSSPRRKGGLRRWFEPR